MKLIHKLFCYNGETRLFGQSVVEDFWTLENCSRTTAGRTLYMC
jgi:hypothetical protein